MEGGILKEPDSSQPRTRLYVQSYNICLSIIMETFHELSKFQFNFQ